MRSALASFAVLALLAPAGAGAIDLSDTRLVAEPATSGRLVAFAYANDLWVAGNDGSAVRRLTSHPGVESGPRFSPDGSLVAFTGRYEGNTDVFVVPAAGGLPKRLTWHPGTDVALGFTPDGKSVLFSSGREVHTARYTQLFTVAVTGGFPEKLKIPNASKAAISADGRTTAYVPLSEAFNQWKHYRGGTTARILLFDNASYAVEQVPQPAGRCNDTDPMWVDGKLYFRSDRDGEFNLYAYERATKAVSRVTTHSDFPVLSPSAGGGRIAYEQAGYVHLLDATTGVSTRLKLGVASDLVELRPRWAKGAKWIRAASLSPHGARVAFEFRGEIVTLPREKGDDRNLTQSPGVHERAPAWSPDGKWIAYFSDQGGENALQLAPQDGKGTPRRVALQGSGFYGNARWSPDSKKLSFSDNSMTIFVLDIASGKQTKVSSEVVYGPVPVLHHAWSPDSRFLAYTQNTSTYFNRLFLYSLAEGRSYAVSDGLADATSPAFDASGKYLYFLVSTDAGPVNDWFSQANADMRAVQQVYLAVLAKGVPSPLLKESDEEKDEEKKKDGEKEDETLAGAAASDAKKAGAAKAAAVAGKDEGKTADVKKPVEVEFDADGLSQRILSLPVKAGVYSDLQPGPANQVLYRRAASTDRDADASVYRYDLEKRKEDTLLEKANAFTLSADTKRAIVRVKEDWHIVEVSDKSDKVDLAKFKLDLGRIQVKVDPPAEWAQMLDEAWRINRDYFYDPGFHGADWPAMRRKYAAFVPDLACRNDLSRVVQWMLSELSVGHSYQSGGDSAFDSETIPGGLLGADYEVVERSLSLQEGIRRPQLVAGPALAAHRAWRRREGGRVPAGRGWQAARVPGGPLRALRAHGRPHRPAHRRTDAPTARARGASTWCPSTTSARCVTGTGWRATCAASPRPRRARSPTSTCRTRPARATPTSSATSSRRPTARPSSSTSATTAAARWPTTTSTSCGGRW